MKTNKKVTLNLIGIDANANSILAAFTLQAEREGWMENEIEAVIDEATSGDYNYLLNVINKYCERAVINSVINIPVIKKGRQCLYDQWYDGILPNPNGFTRAMIKLWHEADGTNRQRLIDAFPEFFAGSKNIVR